ncbi:hypothetical protein GCM10010232_06160 [Streptomyces amakusaensis]|uniref:Cupin domain-containing protein n=1 Tax=Streptomyces amakusaensis TaxID=67271 RepID=A0ABW0ACJ7_9ACTN
MNRTTSPKTARRGAFAAALGLAAAMTLTGATTTSAAPEETRAKPAPAPVVSKTLSEGDTSLPFAIKADDNRRFVYRKLTVQPGATGGWHTHAGEQVAVIKSGVLTRYDKDCKPHVYRAGDALVEPAEPTDVHIGINEGKKPLVLYVVDLLPQGAPVATPAANPGCANLPN